MTPGAKRYIRRFNYTVLLVVVMNLYPSVFDLDETARRDQSIQMQRSNILKNKLFLILKWTQLFGATQSFYRTEKQWQEDADKDGGLTKTHSPHYFTEGQCGSRIYSD